MESCIGLLEAAEGLAKTLWLAGQYSVGADAYIGPPGSCEFAADYRKNGAICRVDATPAG